MIDSAVQYAQSGVVRVAYEAIGDGPVDIAGSGVELVDRGLFELEGVEGRRQLFAAV